MGVISEHLLPDQNEIHHGCALQAQQRGKAEAKFLDVSSCGGTRACPACRRAPAERGEGEERALRDAPLPARPLPCRCPWRQRRECDGGEVDEEILHRRPPFAPDLPDLPPDFPEAADSDPAGLGGLSAFGVLRLRADAGFCRRLLGRLGFGGLGGFAPVGHRADETLFAEADQILTPGLVQRLNDEPALVRPAPLQQRALHVLSCGVLAT